MLKLMTKRSWSRKCFRWRSTFYSSRFCRRSDCWNLTWSSLTANNVYRPVYCTNKSLNKFSIIQSWLISRAATRLLITSICKSQSLNSLTALLRQRLHSQWKDAILWITPTWIKYQIQQIHLNRHLPSTLSKEPCWCCFANEKISQWFHPSPDRRLDRFTMLWVCAFGKCWKRTQHR